MLKWFARLPIFAFALLIVGGGNGRAQEKIYTIHPPKLSVPKGNPGEIRRCISQFQNWTLICDENKVAKEVVCNVTQSIQDQNDTVIFSWSLAASDNGQPFFLFRTPTNVDNKIPIELKFYDSKKMVKIEYVGCDENICLAQSIVGPVLSEAIAKSKNLQINYRTKKGETLTFTASFNGLKDAVESIQ